MLDSPFSRGPGCMSELVFLSAVEMAEQIRQKKISPVELVEAHLAQIAALNPHLNAFVALDEERARRKARELEAAAMRGEWRGPLHGVPISIKSSCRSEERRVGKECRSR